MCIRQRIKFAVHGKGKKENGYLSGTINRKRALFKKLKC